MPRRKPLEPIAQVVARVRAVSSDFARVAELADVGQDFLGLLDQLGYVKRRAAPVPAQAPAPAEKPVNGAAAEDEL